MLKDLEPSYIALYISFSQIKSEAEKLIKETVGKNIPVKIEGDKDVNDAFQKLRIRVEFDDSILTDDEVIHLSSRGFSAKEPYNNAEKVLEEMTEGVPYSLLPRLMDDEYENDTYILIEVPYEYYED